MENGFREWLQLFKQTCSDLHSSGKSIPWVQMDQHISRAFLTCAVPGVCPCRFSLGQVPSWLSWVLFVPLIPRQAWLSSACAQSPGSSSPSVLRKAREGEAHCVRDSIRDELPGLVNHWPPENVHCDVILQFHLRVNTLLSHAWLCNFQDRSG